MEAVVTHHPVVVHGKAVACGFFAVNVYFVSFDGKFVTLIGADDALVPCNVLGIYSDTLALAWNLKALEVGDGVVDVQIFRELVQI